MSEHKQHDHATVVWDIILFPRTPQATFRLFSAVIATLYRHVGKEQVCLSIRLPSGEYHSCWVDSIGISADEACLRDLQHVIGDQGVICCHGTSVSPIRSADPSSLRDAHGIREISQRLIIDSQK